MAQTPVETRVAPAVRKLPRPTLREQTSSPAVLVQSSNDPTLWRTTGFWLVTAKAHKPVLENARVRVFVVTFKPGAKAEWHGHPDHVVGVLTDAKLRFKSPDGKTTDITTRAGETLWVEAGPHQTINMGTNEARLLVVELK